MNNILGAHILVLGVWFFCQEYSMENIIRWVTTAVRYIFYLLSIRGFHEIMRLSHSLPPATTVQTMWRENTRTCLSWGAAGALVLVTQGRVGGEDILLLWMAYILHQYLFKEQPLKPTINYGTGMACSFFQGYLKLVIPGDGTRDNFVDKLCKWEDREGVVFPVKKLLIVVTKSLWCPPDLREFNRLDCPGLPQIGACESLEELQVSVAGVRNRSYKNSAYNIYWPDCSRPPVYVAAECATPIHTLHGVVHAHDLYRELVGADTEELVEDFCAQLQRIVSRSPACRGKVHIVRFDDSPGSGQYLPQLLLDTVAQLEPDYQGIIERRRVLSARDPLPAPAPAPAD